MCLPQTRLQKSVPLATKMSSICQTILQLVSLMTYLFDQRFLRSRLQLSSLFKLIPKPSMLWRQTPAHSGECQEVCGSMGLICLSTSGCCAPKFRVSPLLGDGSSLPVRGSRAVQVSGWQRDQQTRRKTWVTLDACRNPITLLLLQGIILAHGAVRGFPPVAVRAGIVNILPGYME